MFSSGLIPVIASAGVSNLRDGGCLRMELPETVHGESMPVSCYARILF